MAGEWIRMRPSLLEHPKLHALARELCEDPAYRKWWAEPVHGNWCDGVTSHASHASRLVTVGGLLRVWGAANEHARDGVLPGIQIEQLDDLAGIPGFGRAMETVNWACESTDPIGVSLPGFDGYNTPVDSRRALSGAERTRKWRRKQCDECDEKVTKCDVTVTSRCDDTVTKCDGREEKRREENIPPPVIPPKGGHPAEPQDEVWSELVHQFYRFGMTPRQEKGLVEVHAQLLRFGATAKQVEQRCLKANCREPRPLTPKTLVSKWNQLTPCDELRPMGQESA